MAVIGRWPFGAINAVQMQRTIAVTSLQDKEAESFESGAADTVADPMMAVARRRHTIFPATYYPRHLVGRA